MGTGSVLQEWVMNDCTLRMQGVLVLALRGPDGVAKEDPAKPIVRTLRALVMNSGRLGVPMGHGEYFVGDRFMTMTFISDVGKFDVAMSDFFDQWDAYNVHFLQHLMHAYAVAGIKHPNTSIRRSCWAFYVDCCHKLHMNNESDLQIITRLRDGIRVEEDE